MPTTQRESMPVGADENRLAELVLYVSGRCQTHQLWGKVKLNKILFYADFNAYRRLGQSITGAQYAKQIFGPVPQHIDTVIDRLAAAQALTTIEVDTPDMKTQHRVVPLRRADLSGFTAEQIAIVDEVIDWTHFMSAKELSELSHETPAWQLARMDETIPYATALLPHQPRTLTANELSQAQAFAAKAKTLA